MTDAIVVVAGTHLQPPDTLLQPGQGSSGVAQMPRGLSLHPGVEETTLPIIAGPMVSGIGTPISRATHAGLHMVARRVADRRHRLIELTASKVMARTAPTLQGRKQRHQSCTARLIAHQDIDDVVERRDVIAPLACGFHRQIQRRLHVIVGAQHIAIRIGLILLAARGNDVRRRVSHRPHIDLAHLERI